MTTEKLTNIGLQNFLKDFKDNSKTEVFESGKQKDEIIKIAKAKMGIDLKNNTDLAGFKTVYTFADVANGNGARLPKYLLLKALPSIIGKPVNINHVRNYVVGYYIDYRYIEAKDQVIAYGIFFKSNFGAEWTEAKSLLKANLLGTSHEVWCPKRSRRYLGDGTYEATAMEFAGGALIYRTHQDALNPTRKMKTAYKDCDVLEMAMQHMDENPSDLIFASLDDRKQKTYESEDLIVASEAEEFARRTEAEIEQKVATGFHRSHENVEQPQSQEAPVEEVQPQPQAVPKVVCGHCKHEFETMDVGELSCAECKSIIDRSGKVLFPPQIIDFKFRDPENGFANWRLLENGNEKVIVKNLESGKIYQLTFKKPDDNDKIINRMNFVYVGTASCPQCGYSQSISTTSKVEKYHLECKSCGLKYHKNIKKDSLGRQIAEYTDITEEYKNRLLKKEEPDPMADETRELHVASLQENPFKELEVASLTGTEETICNLEIASLQDTDATLELEMASQDSAEDVSSNEVLELSIASLNSEDEVEKVLDVANEQQIEKYKVFIRKMVNKVRSLKREINLETANLKSANTLEVAKIQEDAEKKIGFYKANAVELIKRRDILGEFGEELSDAEIMDDEIFAKANLEKENALLKASMNSESDIVGDKRQLKDDPEISRLAKEIDSKAFSSQN